MLDDQMHLSGQLSDWSVADLLQIMQVTNKTGSLDITGELRGRLHFCDGKLTAAELLDPRRAEMATELDDAADVVFALASMGEGTFAVGSVEGPEGPGFAVGDVLENVDNLRQIEGEVIESGLIECAAIRVPRDLERPITLDPEDWRALVTLIQPFSFETLDTRLGRSEAIRALHGLHRLGLAEAVEDEPDEWLEEIASAVGSRGDEPTWAEQEELDSLSTETEADDEPQESEEPAELPPLQPVVGTVDESDSEPVDEPDLDPVDEPILDPVDEPILEPVAAAESESQPRLPARGVAAPASTTLTDGVYDEIRRLRSKAAEK